MFNRKLFHLNKRKNNVKSDELQDEKVNPIVKSNKLQNYYLNKDQPNLFEILFSGICGLDVKSIRRDEMVTGSTLDDYKSSHTDNNSDAGTGKGSLELFFQSLLKNTSEFTDEEILILQIEILKIVKNMKTKKELKQNFRKYCLASIHFKDSIMHLNGNVNLIP